MHAVWQNVAKRLCRRTNDDDDDVRSSSVASSADPPCNGDLSASSYTGPCLLPLLQPVHHCLHPLLSSKDAARLMRASRSITVALLSDYSFVDHVFEFSPHTPCHHISLSAVKCCIALYTRYRMRVLRMCLPANFTGPLVGGWTGKPLLPPSLLSLSFGADNRYNVRRSIAYYPLDGSGGSELSDEEWWEWCGPDGEVENKEFYRRIRPVNVDTHTHSEVNTAWNVRKYANTAGEFNLRIRPGALPHGLRFLQFNDKYNRPLQQGSIPDTVEVLQFGSDFNKPFEVGHLPASLIQLNLGSGYNQPLLPGVLPASLQRLYVGSSYTHKLPLATVPPQLKELCLGVDFNRPLIPGAIPPSVTHLRLSSSFNQPLQPGSIPHGVAHLQLGDAFNHPLLPCVLPTSLRELVIGCNYNHRLQAGSLPDGLEVLAFVPWSTFDRALQPGVIPASLTVLDLPESYSVELVAGCIPATVKFVRLSDEYAEKELAGVLSSSTRTVWWADGWQRWEL